MLVRICCVSREYIKDWVLIRDNLNLGDCHISPNGENDCTKSQFSRLISLINNDESKLKFSSESQECFNKYLKDNNITLDKKEYKNDYVKEENNEEEQEDIYDPMNDF